MVKNLPAVERSTKIRFGKNVPDSTDQAENTIVFNASNVHINAEYAGSVYMTPLRVRTDVNDRSITVLTYNRTTKEVMDSGAVAEDILQFDLEDATRNGNTTSNTIQFVNPDISFITSGNVGIANGAPIHTVDIGSNLYIDDTGLNVLVVSGNVAVLRDMVIDGNLRVNGDTSIIYTENTAIKDALIELGQNNTSADTTLDLGILMHRPDALSNVVIGYREGTDEFAIGYTDANPTDKTFTPKTDEDINVHVYGLTHVDANIYAHEDVLVDGNVSVAEELTISNNVYAQKDLEVVGNVYVDGNVVAYKDLLVSGNVSVTEELTISGNVYAQKDLEVVGNVYVDGNVVAYKDLLVSGNVTVTEELTISNNVYAQKDLEVMGNVYVDGNVVAYKDLLVSGNVTVTEELTISNNVYAQKDLEVMGNVYVDGNVVAYKDLLVSGNVTVTEELTISNNVYAQKDLEVMGNVYVDGNVVAYKDLLVSGNVSVTEELTISNNVYAQKDLEVMGNVYVDGNVVAYKDLLVSGNVTVTEELTIGNNVYAQKDLEVVGNVYVDGNVVAYKDLLVSGNVTVTEELTIGNNVYAQKDLEVVGNVYVDGNVVAYKDLLVSGNVTVTEELTISNNVYAHKDLEVVGNVYVDGNVVAYKDLLVSGNVNVTKQLSVSGNAYVSGNVEVTKSLIVSANTHLKGPNVFVTNTMNFLNPKTAIVTDQVSNVQIRLGQLENVSNTVSNPLADQVIMYDGNRWMNTFPNHSFLTIKNAEPTATLVSGNVVYISGYQNQNLARVKLARADSPLTMPAIGIVYGDDIPPDEEGLAAAYGKVNQMNTNGYQVGETLYVSNLYAGWISNVKPYYTDGTPNLIQNVGVVTRKDTNSGAMFVTGIGRANDIPNAQLITDYNEMNYVYVNDVNNDFKKIASQNLNIPLTTAVSSSSNSAANAVTLRGVSITSGDGFHGDLVVAGNVTVDTNTFHVDAETNRVGLGTTTPGYLLDVRGAANVGTLTTTTGTVTNGTHSTSKDTGVFVLTQGGLGVEANIHSTNVFAVSHIAVGTSETSNTFDVRGTSNVGALVATSTHISDATAVSSKTTGALQVTGGVGIQGDIHATHVNFEDVEADSVTVTDATAATDKTSGALQVTGGVGIQGDLYAADTTLDSVKPLNMSTNTLPITDGSKKLVNSFITQDNGAIIISANVEITGNISVVGNSFQITSNDLVITDRIITIANNNPSHDLDIGIIMEHPSYNIGIIHHGSTHTGGAPGHHMSFGYINEAYDADSITWKDTAHITANVWGHLITQNTITIEHNDLFVVDGRIGVGVGDRENDNRPSANIHVVGNAFVTSNITTSSNVLVMGDAAAASKTTGALQVVGGVGVQGDIHATNVIGSGTASFSTLYGTIEGSNTASVSDLTASGTVKAGTLTGTTLYGTIEGSNTASFSTLYGTIEGSNTASFSTLYGTIEGSNTASFSTLYGTIEGSNTASFSTLYGTIEGSNTGSFSTLYGTIEGSNTGSFSTLYGTIEGSNTASFSTLYGTIEGSNTASFSTLYGTIEGSNTGSFSTLYGTIEGSNTASFSTLYGTIEGSNTASFSTLYGTIEGSNTASFSTLYGTLSGSNTASMSTLTAVGTTQATDTLTGAITVAGGISTQTNVHAANVYISGGLVTNTGGVTRKTYSYSGTIGDTEQPHINVCFTNHSFTSKITAQLIEGDDEISSIIVDCCGGNKGGNFPASDIKTGSVQVFGPASTNAWNVAVVTDKTTVALRPYGALDGAGEYHIFVEYTTAKTAGAVANVVQDTTEKVVFGY
jgi:predicted acyltransferase (DUF342 family)